MNVNFTILFVFLLFSTSEYSTWDIDSDVVYIDVGLKMNTNQTQPVRRFRPDSCRDVISKISRPIVILSSGLEVMCDTETDGGGWIIIQRRFNGHLNFYRGWEDYKYGFGDLGDGEFYLGNEHIHRITVQARHELRIDMKLIYHVQIKNKSVEVTEDGYFAKYGRFSLFGVEQNYKLKIAGYSGTVGDSLIYHHGSQFATYDWETTQRGSSCAETNYGAWWYNTNEERIPVKKTWRHLCHMSNLNGAWNSSELGKGMNWYNLTGFVGFVSFTEMKIREITV